MQLTYGKVFIDVCRGPMSDLATTLVAVEQIVGEHKWLLKMQGTLLTIITLDDDDVDMTLMWEHTRGLNSTMTALTDILISGPCSMLQVTMTRDDSGDFIALAVINPLDKSIRTITYPFNEDGNVLPGSGVAGYKPLSHNEEE